MAETSYLWKQLKTNANYNTEVKIKEQILKSYYKAYILSVQASDKKCCT